MLSFVRGRPDEVGHDLWNLERQLALGLSGNLGEPAGGWEGRSITGPLRSTAGFDLISFFLGLLLPGWSSLEGNPPTNLNLLLPLGLQIGPLGESLDDRLVADHVR